MKTKSIILFLVLITFAQRSKAQTYVLIPDANFATYLQGLIPTAMNGNSLNITNNLVTTSTQALLPNGLNISNLSGVQYFTSLNYLNCSSNSLTSLPVLPNSLTQLICGLNSLSSLPALPNSLTYIDCSGNSLSSLPTLPNQIIQLDCQNNSLTSLPTLPNLLQSLFCHFNSLTSLPVLPNSLTSIQCNGNSLTSLPTLPSSLQYIDCSSNSLTSLPTLPNSLFEFYCEHNNIICFPLFPNSISTINLYFNPYTCLPNYVLPAMNAYTTTPLCTASNTAGCAVAGIKEFNQNNYQVSVYPNPNSGSFKIQMDNEIQDGEMILINSLGQTIHEQKYFEEKMK